MLFLLIPIKEKIVSTYKKVVIAIDLEGGADDVLKKASNILADKSADITVLNVVYTAVQLYGGYGYATMSSDQNSIIDEDEIRAELLPKLQALTEKSGLPEYKINIEFGKAVDTILDAAKEADLIILGSHGKHGLGLLLGSTANGVLHRAKCDVLAVRMQE
jgi:universal stress protein A